VGGDNKATNSFFVGRPDYTVMVGRQTIDGDDSWYLVDDRGVTLYIDTNDTPDQADCNSEGCLANWPLMLAPEQIVIPSALSAEDFGTFSRGDLGQQLTFFAAQLYYFKNDLNTRGNVNGHGLADKFESARFQF
jgi:predicted lipoprotein with Yx(FWY)xxD motif